MMPNDPLVILHVSLTDGISDSIQTSASFSFTSSLTVDHALLSSQSRIDAVAKLGERRSVADQLSHLLLYLVDPTRCVTFFMAIVFTVDSGLKGIELGNSLIKRCVRQLHVEYPHLKPILLALTHPW